MSEWQPIETAPKNTRILVYIPGFVWGDKIWTSIWANGWIANGMHLSPEEQPTHWMPLPEPPK